MKDCISKPCFGTVEAMEAIDMRVSLQASVALHRLSYSMQHCVEEALLKP